MKSFLFCQLLLPVFATAKLSHIGIDDVCVRGLGMDWY